MVNEKEIITAWKCCSNVITSSCKECPFHITYNANCVSELMRVSLDLFNRTKAENERLRGVQIQYVRAYFNEFAQRLKSDCSLAFLDTDLLNKVIDDLVEAMEVDFSNVSDFTALIKSEAYREFADRLKDVPSIIIAGQKHYVIVETYFDNTIKELTEQKNDLRSESMDVAELRKSLNSIYADVSDANFNDKYQIKEVLFRLIRFNEDLVAEIEKAISQ